MDIRDTREVSTKPLDNFTVENKKKAVELINSKYEIESSGGITLQTIEGYAKAGVDFVSVEYNTRSADMYKGVIIDEHI